MSVAKIFLVVLIIALCSSFAALGQGVLKLGDDTEFAADTNLLIDAQVLLGGKPVKNVTVFVVHKGSVIKEAKTQNDGFFDWATIEDDGVLWEYEIQTCTNLEANTYGDRNIADRDFIKSTIEVIGVASITPFVAVMVNPEIVQTNQYLNYAYEYFRWKI